MDHLEAAGWVARDRGCEHGQDHALRNAAEFRELISAARRAGET